MPSTSYRAAWCMALVCGCGGTPAASPPDPQSDAGLDVHCPASGADADADGLSDRCELDLAVAFAPALRVASGGCNWDTSMRPARLGGEYLFAVERRAAGRVRVAYLPAYYRDCGWSGIKCWLPVVNCAPHVGDSEFMVLDLARAPADQRWRVDAIFLSAHCFGSGDDCRWFRGPELARFEWVGGAPLGAPILWVAEGRQANYPSESACDAGHSSIDTCDRHDIEYRYPIGGVRQNIGSRRVPLGGSGGCVTAEDLGSRSALPAPGVEECFWRAGARFGGWQPRTGSEGVTPYARYLLEVADL